MLAGSGQKTGKVPSRTPLTREDMALLFGLNGAAVNRIANFANGHSCEVVFTAGDVVVRRTKKGENALVEPSPT